MIIGLAKTLLLKCGFEIIRTSGHKRTMRSVLRGLKSDGFYPTTVIDVGVAHGTPELYEEFPDARFLLVEPLTEFGGEINKILENVNGRWVQAAATSKSGIIDLLVADKLSTSGMYEGRLARIARKVDAVKLDDVTSDIDSNQTVLLKIDIEGGELEALAGASELVNKLDHIILEVTFFGELIGAVQFSDVIKYMDNMDFRVAEIFNMRSIPGGHELSQADILFVRRKP